MNENSELTENRETLPDIFTQTSLALAGIEEAAKEIPAKLESKTDYKACEVQHKKNKKIIAALNKFSKERLDEIREDFESKKLEVNNQKDLILNRMTIVQAKLGLARINYEEEIEAKKIAEREEQLRIRKAEALKLKKENDEVLAHEEDRLFEIKKGQAAAAQKIIDDQKELDRQKAEFEKLKAENNKPEPKEEPTSSHELSEAAANKDSNLDESVDTLEQNNKTLDTTEQESETEKTDAKNSDETTMTEILDAFKFFWDEFEAECLIRKSKIAQEYPENANIIEMFFFDIQEAVKEFSGKIKQ